MGQSYTAFGEMQDNGTSRKNLRRKWNIAADESSASSIAIFGVLRVVVLGLGRNRKTRQAMAKSMVRRHRRAIAMGRLCLHGRRTRWKSRTLPTPVSLQELMDQLIEGYSRKESEHGVSKAGLWRSDPRATWRAGLTHRGGPEHGTHVELAGSWSGPRKRQGVCSAPSALQTPRQGSLPGASRGACYAAGNSTS